MKALNCICAAPAGVHAASFICVMQDLTRHSLLRMLRAQSAMVSVYKQHVACTQNWGLARWVM